MSIYINKSDLYNELGKIPAPAGASDFKADIYMCIDREENIDAVDIVLCKDCMNCIEKNGHANCDGWLLCRQFNRATDDMNSCSWGRRA